MHSQNSSNGVGDSLDATFTRLEQLERGTLDDVDNRVDGRADAVHERWKALNHYKFVVTRSGASKCSFLHSVPRTPEPITTVKESVPQV